MIAESSRAFLPATSATSGGTATAEAGSSRALVIFVESSAPLYAGRAIRIVRPGRRMVARVAERSHGAPQPEI